MAARGTKSVLQFGLVRVPVTLYLTSEPTKPAAWEKAGPGGGRILPVENAPASAKTVAQRADPLAEREDTVPAETTSGPARRIVGREDGGGLVYNDEVRHGIRREDGTFVDLTDGIEQIKQETKLEEMRVADFVRVKQIARERIQGSYWLAASDQAGRKVLALMYAAMRETGRVGVVKFTKRSNQSLAALVPMPRRKAIAVLELAWAEDQREVPEMARVGDVDVAAAEAQVAVELVQALSSGREAIDALTDDARELRRQLIETGKIEQRERVELQEGAEVIDLMRRGLEDRDALKRSAA